MSGLNLMLQLENSTSIPLSAAVGRRIGWHCLTKCNVRSLKPPITDELLVFHLNGVFALCGIDGLRLQYLSLEDGDDWIRGSIGKFIISLRKHAPIRSILQYLI